MISIFEVSLDKQNDMNYTSIIVSLDKKRYDIYIEYSKRYGNHIEIFMEIIVYKYTLDMAPLQ